MTYELRDRQENKVYREISSSDSESESDGVHEDPDYYRPARRPRRQLQLITVNMVNPEMDAAAGSAARRRPGRPPRNAALALAPNQVPFEQVPRRRRKKRARFSLQRSLGYANNNLRRFQDKKTILAWMMDMELIKENQIVFYLDNAEEKITLHGLITRAGILCNCCVKVVTTSDFEAHAQSDKRGEPYKHIYLRNGRSLFQYLVKAWYDRIDDLDCSMLENFEPPKDAWDKSDDACIVCADGGDLICCDNCPSTFHFSCLKMEGVPEGDWFCPYCVCKHCELSEGIPEDFSKCILCGKKYHLACYVLNELNLNTNCKLFCGQDCEEVYEKLQNIMGVKNDLGEGLSWTLVHQRDLFLGHKKNQKLYPLVECNAKVALAWTMMDQSFKPIVDRFTKINVIQNVIFSTSSKLTRINFRGFFTAVLEKDEEIICAASMRLHGKKMAEMPFVATHRSYRKKGMMKKLLVAIESALYFMEVENLVLPSAQEVVAMWINKFHFSTIPSFLEKDVVQSNMLMFPQSVKLQKSLFSRVTAMEIDQVGGNDSKGMAPESSSKRVQPFDLNLVPPEEDENVIMT